MAEKLRVTNIYRAREVIKVSEEELKEWSDSPITQALLGILKEYSNETLNNSSLPNIYIGAEVYQKHGVAIHLLVAPK